MTWTPSFQTDRDALRPESVDISTVQLALDPGVSGIRPGTATITTATSHNFVAPEQGDRADDVAAWYVTISGAGEPFDGTWRLETVPSATTFTFRVSWTEDVPSTSAPSGALATSPALAYLRYFPNDVLLSDVSNAIQFYAQAWDYNTIRIVWNASEDLDNRVLNDVSANRTPKLAVTRSGFGHPTTLNDGQLIFNRNYTDVVKSDLIYDPAAIQPTLNTVQQTFEVVPSDGRASWDRPATGVVGLFDRNLPEGRWFYYSLFVYVSTYDADGNYLAGPYWVKAGEAQAVTPMNYRHGEKLYQLLPPYYRMKDAEFTAGTGRAGDLQRLLEVVGFELDHVRTLIEGVERVYDMDAAPNSLVTALGISNFGLLTEAGLGEIRYRSLLAAASDLYDERGSMAGLRRLTESASKYRCKVIEGLNLLNLTDDAEFSSGTGSWGDLAAVPAYATWATGTTPDVVQWLGQGNTSFTTVGTLETVEIATSGQGELTASVFPRRRAMRVVGTSVTSPVLLTCGLGVGEVYDRYHKPVAANFYPRLHGVKCKPGNVYTFSAYVRRGAAATAGNTQVGILWFNDPENSEFNITNDFISASTSPGATTGTAFARYSIEGVAPLSNRGQGHVFAVPFIALAHSSERFITACMLHDELNSAASFAVTPDVFLTLGDATETLGDPDIFLGGV